MDILYIAPQPLYQDRGTSIANKMVLEVFSKRGERVDVVTYHEGQEVAMPNITIHRIPTLPGVKNIRPGFSFKKLLCDLAMIPLILRLVLTRRYQLVHAVEESVFFALLLRLFFGIPYVYDMDSSLAQQMVEKYSFLKFLAPALNFMEGLAVKHAKAVIVVCDALGEIAKQHDPERIVTLRDVPLLDENEDESPTLNEGLRQRYKLENPIMMYVGNLESYQGIDLLLESFKLTLDEAQAELVIIGGAAADLTRYSEMASRLGIAEHVYFLGPRPISTLGAYLSQADILVSPRIKGNNTPMKIYSYLYSGKPVLATDLWTHTQVLDSESAMLAAPEAEAFAKAAVTLIEDEAMQQRLGEAGVRLIEEKYDYSVFLDNLNGLMDWLKSEVKVARAY